MKEGIHIKIIAHKKGTPLKEIRKLIKAVEAAWEETYPGEKMICIPLEVDDEKQGKRADKGCL